MFSQKLPDNLRPMRDIQHAIYSSQFASLQNESGRACQTQEAN